MPTREDLVVRALDLLGVTQAGQDPDANDAAKVDSFILPTVTMLRDERVAVVDPSNVSNGVFEQLAAVLANMAAPAFGTPRDRPTIEADKDALRVAQAAEGGAFSRRRMEFSGSAQRALQGGEGFAGTAQRALQDGRGFAGTAQRALQDGRGFAGTAQRALQDGRGFAGTAKAPLTGTAGFAGSTDRPLAAASNFAGTGARPLSASPGMAGTLQRPLQGAK